MHNMSTHQLPQFYQPLLVPSPDLNHFSHMIYSLQTSMYQNIAKFLTHPCILAALLEIIIRECV